MAACIAFLFIPLVTNAASGGPDDEVRATFERFVAAQNAHDVKAVESLLLNSPDFLWITRGTPVWGPDPALKRFAALYEGTWRLDPEASSLKMTMLGNGAAQLYVPIMFTIGAAGQPAQPTRFLMNLILVKTPGGWKVSSILPIPAPAQ
jgi:ketosteroid isomerase-like protein